MWSLIREHHTGPAAWIAPLQEAGHMSAPDDPPRSAPKIPLALGAVTHVAELAFQGEFPLPRHRHATRSIPAMPSALKRFVSVTRVDIGCLPLGVSRGDLLAEGFEAVHSRLDPASHVTADQSFHVARPKRLLARRMSFGRRWRGSLPFSGVRFCGSG